MNLPWNRLRVKRPGPFVIEYTTQAGEEEKDKNKRQKKEKSPGPGKFWPGSFFMREDEVAHFYWDKSIQASIFWFKSSSTWARSLERAKARSTSS